MLRLVLLIPLFGACTPTRDLSELVQQDSTYYEPETMLPYSGRVYRPFRGDSTRMELEGTLQEGTWHGDLVVYHPNGRVRYMGALANGAPCGAWTENADAEARESIYEELVQEIESMGIYLPCPEGM